MDIIPERYVSPLLHIVLVWLLAWTLLVFCRKLLAIFRSHVITRIGKASDYRRIDTLSNVFRHAAVVVVVGVAIMLSLSQLGISIAPVLATAGVAGIAVGFGAQSLVRDFFSGLFLLIENQVSEGDVIEAAGKSGYVEEVTLRHIRLRDDDGGVHFIPNGIITTVTNRSRGYAFAVIDVPVPRRESIDRMFALLREVGETLRHDPVLGPEIIGDIEIAGVEKMEDANLTVRCRLKTMPTRQAGVRQEFLRRTAAALETHRLAAEARAAPAAGPDGTAPPSGGAAAAVPPGRS